MAKLVDFFNSGTERAIQLSKQWIGTDEKGNTIDINKINTSSKISVKWKCEKGHLWNTTILSRVYNNTGCPYCSGRLPIICKTDLLHWCDNNVYGNILKTEWCKENGSMQTYTYGTDKKVKWKCHKCNKYWISNIHNRVFNNTGCPHCYNSINKENSLQNWCDKNGKYGSILLKQINDSTDASDVATYSHKRIKWKCKNGHEWEDTIADRTHNKTGCPICNRVGTSYSEQVIYFYFKLIYSNTINRGKYKGYEFDITIPELKTSIEFNGITWHSDEKTQIRDYEKANICRKHGVKFITILQSDTITGINTDDKIYTNSRFKNVEDTIDVIRELSERLNISVNRSIIQKAIDMAHSYMNGEY